MSDSRSDKVLPHLALPDGGAWQRWNISELPPLPDPPTGGNYAGAPLSPPDREALRARIREQSQEEGFKAGFIHGQTEGHKAGLEQGHQTGHALGLEAGRQEAREELRQQIEQTVAPLSPLAGNFDEALKQLTEDTASEIVELALAVGSHLARVTLDMKPELVLGIVRDLLHMEPALTGKPRLWLHPQDLLLVQQVLGNELEAADWTLQPDDQVSRGGCRITGNSGAVDATWEQRLQSVRTSIRRPRSRSKLADTSARKSAT